jgi:hypothetical protein
MDSFLDGNAAAGRLSEVFAQDATAFVVTCAACGDQAPLGSLRAYMGGPGLVLRCGSCDAAQIRLVSSGDRAWIDLRGVRVLQLPRSLG